MIEQDNAALVEERKKLTSSTAAVNYFCTVLRGLANVKVWPDLTAAVQSWDLDATASSLAWAADFAEELNQYTEKGSGARVGLG